MGILLSIITGIFSNFLYDQVDDKIDIWKDKKAIKSFKQRLETWATEFEKRNDGTIVITDRFCSYIDSSRVILRIFEYVADISEKLVPEKDFITDLKNLLIIEIEKAQTLTQRDHEAIDEFFENILFASKEFIYNSLDTKTRGLFYAIVQTKADVQSVLKKFGYTERELSDIKDEVQKIHTLLYEKEAFSLTDEWFIHQNTEQIKNLGDRYIPDLHIPVGTSLVFDGVAKNDAFYCRLKQKSDELLSHFKSSKISKIEDISDAITQLITTVLSNQSVNIDVSALTSMLHDADAILDEILAHLYSQRDNKDDNHINRQIYLIKYARNSITDYLEYINSNEVKASAAPYVLIDGEGGIGKSHIIADAVNNRMDDGSKSLLFLGQHFKGMVPPLQEMMNLISIDKAPDEFLSYLNRVAKEQNKRIIMFIDALNEGNGKTIWKDHFAGIIEKLKNYPWLGLVASIRSEYTGFIFNDHRDLKDEIICVQHIGFRMVEYEATKKYFDFYKITYSEVPLANYEFQNPLFLRLFCEGYKGKHVQFDGIHGIQYSDIYKNYIETINDKITEHCGVNHRYQVVEDVLNEIVSYKYGHDENNFIPFAELSHVILNIQDKYRCKEDLLENLISEGILTQNIDYNDVAYIYVTYERLEDFLYSNKLIEEINSNGKDDFVDAHSDVINKQSILECFAIALAEETDLEVFDIFDPDRWNVQYSFVESLKWRSAQSVTKKTKEYLYNILKNPYEVQHIFDTLILIATKENFPLNGKATVAFISKAHMPDRDAFFIPLYNEIYWEEGSSINRLLDWCLFSSIKSSCSDEFIKLAALMVSTFLISSNMHLRDNATKALAALLKNHTETMISILKYFKDIDDPYILERLYAVAFACAVSEQDDAKLLSLAEYVYEAVFNQEFVYPNILLRDYAKSTIDYANYKLKKLNIDLKKVAPPYKSIFPAIPPDETINKYRYDYKDPNFQDHFWGQNEMLDSMKVEYSRDGGCGGYGDFGRYVFQQYFSDWEELDPNDLRNIAIQRVFDLGYDVEKHGKFDRSNICGRNIYKSTERIGKKYQWIALYELAAQVADNFQKGTYTEDGRKTKTYCLGSFEPYIRNIDPTVSLTKSGNDDMRKRPIHDRIYTISHQDHYTWLSDFDDLPAIDKMLHVEYEQKEYLLLNGSYSWCEEKTLGDRNYQIPIKEFWVDINSYIVKQDQLKTYVKKLYKIDFMKIGIAMPNDYYHLFNKEYYWSEGYHFFQDQYDSVYDEEWIDIDTRYRDFSKDLEKVLVPTYRYVSERSGDNLEYGSISWYKPCAEIVNALNLVYGKEDTVLYDENGNVICFDSNDLLSEKIGFFIDTKVFQEFLKQNGYTVFWTILAEKRILSDSLLTYEKKFPMPHISGLFYYDSNGELIQKINHFDD